MNGLSSSGPHNVQGYRELANRSLPRAVFDYLDGGAEDETTMADNRSAFSRYRLLPKVHENRLPIDLSTSLAGQPIAMPIVLSPIGNAGMLHHDGEIGAARVACRNGIISLLSTSASYTIEEVANAVAGRKPWYQLYTYGDRSFYGSLIGRAAEAEYSGLVVTVDSSVPGNRERDVHNRFTPDMLHLSLKNTLDFLRHPRWAMGVIRHRRVAIKVFSEGSQPSLLSLYRQARESAESLSQRLERVTWDDIGWIRSHWNGPLGIKGILTPGDARKAVDLGAQVVFVSNHGGRQLDSCLGALDALPAVVDAVGSNADVVIDGGVRRGTDIVKALCLGARAVGVGRAWGYGLAAGGADGIDGTISVVERELRTALALLGVPHIRDLTTSCLAP